MQAASGKLVVRAPAKINLSLEVIARRPDGYHELRTIFQSIDLCDTLEVERAERSFDLKVEGDAPIDDNLVLRAARLMGVPGARLRLAKRIPVGAGLGGGSSDAAATIRAITELWSLNLTDGERLALACELGADVPFFLQGGTALARGRGDEVTPLPDLPPLWAVLATPPLRITCKTAHIFRALRPEEMTDGSRTRALADGIRRGDVPRTEDCFNGLLAPALRVLEGLMGYIESLRSATQRDWVLSGAGPTLFRLASTEAEARELAQALEGVPGEIHVTRTLPSAATESDW